MRLVATFVFIGLAAGSHAQSPDVPDAPQPAISRAALQAPNSSDSFAVSFAGDTMQVSSAQGSSQGDPPSKSGSTDPVDANGNPIPLERRQPKRILGFMPNFRSVSGGAKPHPPGWKYNFNVATHQATDYSTFLFLGLTSITAEGTDEHPSLGKGMGGFYAYTWRGFLDKTDGTYLSAWLLPSLLHEDTRFYALVPLDELLVSVKLPGGRTPAAVGSNCTVRVAV